MAISVIDSGIGIAPENLERIFDSFEQIKDATGRVYGGAGLGLAIAKNLVELHGGTLQVESTSGVGSRFTFTLPITTEPAEPLNLERVRRLQGYEYQGDLSDWELTTDGLVRRDAQNKSGDSSGGSSGGFTIMIVDDEDVTRQVLAACLRAEGYVTVQVASGPEALNKLDYDPKPDLILLDLMMPGMTGFEVCSLVREMFDPEELPIIIVSAKDHISDRVQGLTTGANDYLTKPVNRRELLARVRTQLQLHYLREENRMYREILSF